MHQSIATIDSPEFINLQPLDINPLMSSCEIKVLYVGENRNRSYISKEVASDMAKTLRGAPIVGYYKDEKQDFADHGHRMIFDDEGIKCECLTVPYGFVAPDAKVWFQKFEDEDDFGNAIVREYLMTTGYLWTGQFEECKSAVVGEGKPHSMELDNDTLQGHWSTNSKTGMDFFIINDAIFSKLCILGSDVEPCFEGSKVSAPEVSTSFTVVDDTFKKTLYTMMQDLHSALEGGQRNMDIEEKEVTTPVEETPVDTQAQQPAGQEFKKEEDDKEKDKKDDSASSEEKDKKEDNADKKDDKEDEEKKKNFSKSEDEEKDDKKSDDKEKDKKEEEEDDKKKKDFSLELEALQIKYSALEEEYKALVEFKNQVEGEKKDALIKSFYMLSDEDKADVIEHKAEYSLDEIESKLSVICVRKKVNFDLDNTEKNDSSVEEKDDSVATYTLKDTEDSVPAWISALRNTQKSRE